MKKYLFLTILSLALIGTGCQREDLPDPRPELPEDNGGFPLENEEYVVPGVLQVKLTPQAQERFIPAHAAAGLPTGVEAIDRLANQYRITRITPAFAVGGKFEARQRKAGLHLWYSVYFDDTQENAMTRAFTDFTAVDELSVVEPMLRIKRIEGEITPVTEEELTRMMGTRSGTHTMNGPSNDPMLHFQWHYHNEGEFYRSKPGADINLYEAWKIETGKPQVIVAVIDGGIDTTHPDLVQNLWVNQAELNGTEGQDDDNNGYVDDVYGYNFVTRSGKVTPHSHGTHVAGTVAAVNNNGIGVAGVAGGNGSPDSGVRMMSCQIFNIDPDGKESVVADSMRGRAFIYAADNGAVIAQNSWEYATTVRQLTELDKAAIDYFIDNAGKDENGNQVGPLDGGIVIFATGNSNLNALLMPASYERIFSVSSFASDYQKAIYSNYGPWVHVAAPGGSGEYADGTMIFSTYPMGVYGFMAGTSMACPHVSGVAALVVSKYGVNEDGSIKYGFTNQMLWKRLLAGTNRTIQWYNPQAYPMGVGYINAHKALVDDGEMAPDRVGDLTVQGTFEKVTLSWRVTEDSDASDLKTAHYQLVVSEDELYGVDFRDLPAGLNPIVISTAGKRVGERISYEFNDLEMGKTYYFSLAGFDADGNVSPSSTVKGAMQENRGPVAKDLPATVTLRKSERKTYTVPVYDPEGYSWTYSFTPGSAGASAIRQGENLILTFNAAGIETGTYSAALILRDEQGVETEITINYAVTFFVPQLLQAFENTLFQGPGNETQYNLDEYFYDQDGDPITYSAESTNPSVATATVAGNILTVTSTGLGTATVKVTAKDVDGQMETSFTVVTRNALEIVDLFPVPVKKDGILNIRMGEEVKGQVNVTIYSMSGARVFSQQLKMADGTVQRVDLSSLTPANYRVVVKYKNEEITRNITKL